MAHSALALTRSSGTVLQGGISRRIFEISATSSQIDTKNFNSQRRAYCLILSGVPSGTQGKW
eukprot:738282-Pelagomonas_calceolata.AAC.4